MLLNVVIDLRFKLKKYFLMLSRFYVSYSKFFNIKVNFQFELFSHIFISIQAN